MRRHAALLALLAVAGLALILRLAEEQRSNVFARVPINDAAVYWSWAGDIAHGRLVGHEPFFSAPLYPYVLGALRAAGGGLLAAGLLQVALHLLTATLLARVGRRLCSERAGLLAAALYLLCADPAFHVTRLLNDTLACLLVAATWERALAFRDEPGPRRGAVAGLLAGLAVLTQPSLLPFVPLLALWSWRAASRFAPAAALLGAALLPVGFSLAHNLAACGEPILVSAQGGVTFAIGNAPGADGTYFSIPGVSVDRAQQNQDARELVRGETDGSWRGTDAAFWSRGLSFWREQPHAAARLVMRRLWWFLSGHNYGDIYTPALEAEQGLQPWAWTSPLPAPWLIFPGLVALLLALRARPWLVGRVGLPELVLVAAPLLSVLLFFYSPRYRAPALPLLATFAALALAGLFTERRGARLALALGLLAGPASTLLNRAIGFDDVATQRARHAQLLGNAYKSDGQPQEALVHYRRAIDLGATEALADAGDLLRRTGQPEQGLAMLREAAARRPQDADAQRLLGNALAESGSLGPARAAFEAALAVQPADPRTLTGLGNVLLQQGDASGALARQDRALQLRPDYAFAWANRASALLALKRLDDAVESSARAVAADASLAAHVTAMLRNAGASEAQLARVAPR